MLGLVRRGIRGQRTEAFIRTAGVLAWGWGAEGAHCQNTKKTVEDQKPLEDRDGAGSYFVFCLPHRHTLIDSAGHVRNVEMKCVLTNLFSLARRGGAPPCSVGGGRYLSCPRIPTLGNPGKWGDFSEPVCVRCQDQHKLGCSPGGAGVNAAR